jgi:hypothetical protein
LGMAKAVRILPVAPNLRIFSGLAGSIAARIEPVAADVGSG